jgi:hypothetical protein
MTVYLSLPLASIYAKHYATHVWFRIHNIQLTIEFSIQLLHLTLELVETQFHTISC